MVVPGAKGNGWTEGTRGRQNSRVREHQKWSTQCYVDSRWHTWGNLGGKGWMSPEHTTFGNLSRKTQLMEHCLLDGENHPLLTCLWVLSGVGS